MAIQSRFALLKAVRSMLFVVIGLMLILHAAASASAQFPGAPSVNRGGSPTQAERVDARIVTYEGAVQPGGLINVGVLLDVQSGWKIQAGEGSGDEIEPYIPTTVSLDLPEGWEARPVIWPEAKTFTLSIGDFAEELAGYDGRVLIVVPVQIPDVVEPGEYDIDAEISYQACDATTCEMQVSIMLRGTANVIGRDAPPQTASLDTEIAELFTAALARQGATSTMTNETEGTSTGVRSAPATDDTGADAATAGDAAPMIVRPSFFGITLPDTSGPLGLLLLALFAAIGGFVLNLTPCVLPVIPIKIMTIMQHANKPGKNLVLGLWMAAGVIAFWVGIGLPVALFSSVTDPSRIFGIWWLTLGIGVLIAFMGIGIMGMFSIQLPSSVYAVNPKADTLWGSFVFGVMTAILGLPCFGFVAGALLAGAATLPAVTIMIIFTALGAGMAFPYLLLSAKPSLLERIPRTGPASELVKQVMGFLLLAAAAYFIGSGLIALVNEKPYLGKQLHIWAIALFAVIAGLWLIVRTFQISPKTGPRVSFTIVGLIIGAVAVGYAMESTGKAREIYAARTDALARQGGELYAPGVWNDFTPTAFESALQAGHIVVLDFTAEWCINCKLLKAAVLNRDPVRSELVKPDVVSFTVDLTSTKDPGWDFLRDELGQTGIPLLAIYSPGDEEPWQSNAYTPQQVMAALNDARAEKIARR